MSITGTMRAYIYGILEVDIMETEARQLGFFDFTPFNEIRASTWQFMEDYEDKS